MSPISPLPLLTRRLVSTRRLTSIACFSALVAGLAACGSLTPKPLTAEQLQQQNSADRTAAQADVPPIAGQLTLEEAIARALKYNLELRTRLMEQAVARGQYDLSKYDLLPKLFASAEYDSHSEDRTTRSKDSVTGQPSLANPSIFSDRQHTVGSLALSWNLLDFGLSYYTAQQNANKLLIANEHRRKAMHGLVQDVRTAFWRAAAAQKLQREVRETLTAAEAALANSSKAEQEGVRNPLDSLRYQRQLLENLRLLEAIDQELATAQVELASLINAPLIGAIEIAEPSETVNQRLLATSAEQLEELALAGNADLREQHYNARNAVIEARRTLLKMFPSLNFSYGYNYDNDSYLLHHGWQQAGAAISYNLMNAASIPAQRDYAKAGIALADQHRVATQLAVLTQVHLAQLQYVQACHQFERSDAIWKVDERIATQVDNQAQVGKQSALDGIANRTTSILSLLRRYQAAAQANAADSKLQASLGLELQVPDIEATPLPQLTAVVRTSLDEWQQGKSLQAGHVE